MIVVDSNVLAYLLIPGKFTSAAEQALLADQQWGAPRLWRSELRNILCTYLRGGHLDAQAAQALFAQAEAIIGQNEFEVSTAEVLRLSVASGCSGYDCEFIALAKGLGVRCLTADAKLAAAFPESTQLLVALQH